MQFFPIADAFRFAQAAAPIAINALWQGAAVAAALSICLRFAPRVSSAHRFAAWAAGFAVVAGLPLLPLISHLSAQLMAHLTSASSPASAAALTQPSVHPWLMLEARWSLAIAVLGAVASVFRAAELLSNSLRLRRLWKSATPIKSETAASLAGLCGDHRITICTTGQLDRPSVIGFFAPRILIPGWLFPRLSREELEQVVLHEAEHLRRRDDWTNLLQKLCLVMFPLNPALVFLERRLCREREMACDEAVVRRTRAPRAYAACLASMAERGLKRRAEALSLGAWERRPELVHRVHSILRSSRSLNPIAGRALFAAVCCGLIFGSVELARCPQMVAFLPVETAPAAFEAEANLSGQAQLVPASFAPARDSRRGQPFRAVNVNAILPATRPAMATYSRQRAVTGSRPPRTSGAKTFDLASSSPHEQLLKAEMPSPQANYAGQPQQWVVFAAWEQFQTRATSGQVADYDTGADAAATRQTDASQQTAGQQGDTGRITITRMIFRVCPVAALGNSANSSKSPPRPDSNSVPKSISHQSAAVPFGDGWLVIQL